jgi:predicted TIM-barrel fold metal-dependent hydrolase
MIVDTNVHLGHWPFRFLPWDNLTDLRSRLAHAKVNVAWVALFEGVWHRDLREVNRRLVRACEHPPGAPDVRFLPLGTVNPVLPGWREVLRDCVEVHRLRGLRLYPAYHGYTLADPLAEELLTAAAEAKLFVQLVVKLEDERTQHPLCQVPAVDLRPLPDLVARLPQLRLQVLNASGTVPEEIVVPLARSQRVWFDFAMVEGVLGLANFAEQVGTEQLLFGSHFPLFYPESALGKLKEAALADEQVAAIRAGHGWAAELRGPHAG